MVGHHLHTGIRAAHLVPHPLHSSLLHPLPVCPLPCSYTEYRRHLHNVVHGCRELASCQLMSAAAGDEQPLRGVHITLRMRLQCEIWRCVPPPPLPALQHLGSACNFGSVCDVEAFPFP